MLKRDRKGNIKVNKEEFKLNIVTKLKSQDVGLYRLFMVDKESGWQNGMNFKSEVRFVCREFNLDLRFKFISKEGPSKYEVDFLDLNLSDKEWAELSKIDLSHDDCYQIGTMEWLDVKDKAIIMSLIDFRILRDKDYTFNINYFNYYDTLGVTFYSKKDNREQIEKEINQWKSVRYRTHLYVPWVLTERVEKKLLSHMDLFWEYCSKVQNFSYNRVSNVFNLAANADTDENETTMMKIARSLILDKEGK